MDAGRSDVLQQFLAITGADEATALSVLEACDWQLEGAVELHFATGGDVGGGVNPGAAAGASPNHPAAHDPVLAEDEVRAPIPAKMDRLYGDMGMGMAGMGTGLHGIPQARYGAPPANLLTPGPQHVDAFRDFAAEAAAAAAGVSSAPRARGAAGSSSSKGAGGPPVAAAPGPAKLADMFKPPKDLLYAGTFDQAKGEAAQQGRWLLINVQQNEEFDSHRLNRDTWSQPHVQEVVRGMFVFWQVYDTAPEGKRVVGAYHMNQFPVIAIVDPITGSVMYEREGFMSPDTLLEALVPFMDTGPNDPGAGALAHRAVRRKAAGKTAGSGGGGSGRRVEAMTEDEQLALALAMSAGDGSVPQQGGATPGTSGAGDDSDDDGIDEAAIWEEIRRREAAEKAAAAAGTPPPSAAAPTPAAMPAQPPPPAPAAVDPAAAAAAAAARLPAEPAAGAAGCSQVAVRLPEGRFQRRFLESDTVGVLRDWVCSLVPEAAAGRAFALSAAFPGAPLLSADTSDLQLKDAGVAGSLLVFRWTDG